AIPVAMLVQGLNVTQVITYSLNGFVLPSSDPLFNIVRGGGLIPMLKTIYILLVSCSLAAVIQNGGVLSDKIETYLSRPAKRVAIYIKSCIVGILTTAVGSNQTVSIVMTSQLMKNAYSNSGFSNIHRMQDISFASVLLSIVPPWSLTAMVPLASIQHEGYDYIPFLFFIYIASLYNLFLRTIESKKVENSVENTH
ncbi:MAG: Na+/H+ antiporter NhaC family protein, partial [Oscillospiraceae bacterium]